MSPLKTHILQFSVIITERPSSWDVKMIQGRMDVLINWCEKITEAFLQSAADLCFESWLWHRARFRITLYMNKFIYPELLMGTNCPIEIFVWSDSFTISFSYKFNICHICKKNFEVVLLLIIRILTLDKEWAEDMKIDIRQDPLRVK